MNDLHPFDIKAFINDNKGVVKRFLKKNTLDVVVPDFEDIPKEWLYNGNENMIRKGAKREYSYWQKLEYVKCLKSVVYFTEKYIRIMSVDDGIIPFKLYDYQRELLECYEKNRFTINMQARQSGKTQTTAAYILWFSSFHSSKTVGVLANKANQAREIMQRIQMSFEFLPKFLQCGVQSYNKSSIKFANQSEIFTAASSSSSIRGRSLSLCYIDEAAFLRDDMTFYESTYPVISSGKKSRVIITSTPNGTRGLFYKLWKEAESGKNSYKQFLVTWDMVPGRDQAWKEEQIGNTSPEQFRQEHECVAGDTTVILRDEYGVYNVAIEDLHDIIEQSPDDENLKDRAQGRTGVVYKIIREDMQEYIGTALNIKNRMSQHKGSDRFSEYGILDYEILYEGDYYECLVLEPYFINEYDTYTNGLNESIDGKGNHLSSKFTTLGLKYSEESKRKIAEAHKHRMNYASGWNHEEATKKMWSGKRKGVCHSQVLSENDVDTILKKYDEYQLNAEDCLEHGILKKTQAKAIEENGWDGSENLIGKGGNIIQKIHAFSHIMANEYGVTKVCIKLIIKKGRKCYKS